MKSLGSEASASEIAVNATRVRNITVAVFAALAMLACIGTANASAANNLSVNPGGSDSGDCTSAACATIQYAIDQSATGDKIYVAAGTYVENVTVDKAVEIIGAGDADNETVVMPAIDNPTCTGGGSGSFCVGGSPEASAVFKITSSNVEISELQVNGDNPALVGPEPGYDARIGIATYTVGGPFDGLDVHDTTIKKIYLRSFQNTSGLNFSFKDNTVDTTSGDPSAIGVFNSQGSGDISGNTVVRAIDSISANHSRGTDFKNNDISVTLSGIHTDNSNSGGTTTPDEISGNDVSCYNNGYGIWTFVPYVAPNVHNNTTTRCSVGLAALGGPASGPVPTTSFTENEVDGTGSVTDPPYSSTGVYLTTNVPGFGLDFNNKVDLNRNYIHDNDYGIYTEETNGKTLDVQAHKNAIVNNVSVGLDSSLQTSGVSDFTNNWWGCNEGPWDNVGPNNSPNCDSEIGDAVVDPWLQLTVTASPNTIAPSPNPPDDTSTITSSFNMNSDGDDVGPGLPEQPLSYTTTSGTLTPGVYPVDTVNGTNSQTLTAGPTAIPITVTATSGAQATPVTLNIAGDVTVNNHTGSDTGPPDSDCGNPDFNNIADAVSSVSDGSNVYVCDGNYVDDHSVVTADISILGNPGGGTNVTSTDGTNSFLLEDGADGTTIKDLSITALYPVATGVTGSVDDITIDTV